MGALRSALLLRTGLRARPAEVDRVLAPHCLVKGGGTTRGTQRRRRPILHSLGTTCGKLPNSGSRRGESLVSNGEAHRWKAPRVRQNASLFAERRGKRPWRRWQVAKAISFSGGLASSSGTPDEPRELLSGPVGRSLIGPGPLAVPARERMSGGPRASRSARWARHGHTQARVYPAGSASPAGVRGELHDGRCPSRSGRGEASVASNRDGRRREGESRPAPDP
jgi:hypothetical protein